MSSWGISCFHFWLKDMLLETDMRSRLSCNEAERHRQLLQPPAVEDAGQLPRCSACKLPPQVQWQQVFPALHLREGLQRCRWGTGMHSDHDGVPALDGVCFRAARPQVRAN